MFDSNLRIVLADDHEVVRVGLRALLDSQPDMAVVGEASDGFEACELASALSPDVVIMDLSMPRMNGMLATARIKGACPNAKVIVLTAYEQRGYMRELLNAGAAGYLLKRSVADDLIAAIREVACGKQFVDPALRDSEPSQGGCESEEPLTPSAPLSDRELEVVKMIAAGYSNKEIASLLSISVKTVETYKARSAQKLGISSRMGFVRYALRFGLLEPYD